MIKPGLILLISWYCLFADQSVCWGQVHLRLYDLVYLADEAVTLSDLTQADGMLSFSEKSESICDISSPNSSRLISQEEIKRAVSFEICFDLSSPDFVQVVRGTAPVRSSDLLPAIQRRCDRLAGDSIRVIADLPDRDLLISNELPLSCSIIIGNLLSSGEQVITIEKCNKNGKIARRHITVNLTLTAQLAYPKTMIKRGAVIKVDDLIVKHVDLKTFPYSGLIYHADGIVGLAAARHLSPGSPLRWDQVKLPALIEKGSNIELIVDQDNFTIKTDVTALQDGTLGDEIWVRLQNSGKKLRAVVVNADRVCLR